MIEKSPMIHQKTNVIKVVAINWVESESVVSFRNWMLTFSI